MTQVGLGLGAGNEDLLTLAPSEARPVMDRDQPGPLRESGAALVDQVLDEALGGQVDLRERRRSTAMVQPDPRGT